MRMRHRDDAGSVKGCAGVAGSAATGKTRRRRAMRVARREGCAAWLGSIWFGWCRTYERLLPLVADDAALGRRGAGATGPLASMERGVAHAASGWFGAIWAAELCGCCFERAASGSGTAPAGDARREEGGMRGLVWFGLCSEYERLLPLVRYDGALGGRALI